MGDQERPVRNSYNSDWKWLFLLSNLEMTEGPAFPRACDRPSGKELGSLPTSLTTGNRGIKYIMAAA